YVAIVCAAVNPVLAVEGDVLGRKPVHVQSFNFRKLIILRINTGELRHSRRIPRNRIDGHRPQEKISEAANDNGDEETEDYAFHRFPETDERNSSSSRRRETIFRPGRLRPGSRVRPPTCEYPVGP